MQYCSTAVVTRHSHTQGWPGAGGGGREEVGGAPGEVQQRRLLHHRLPQGEAALGPDQTAGGRPLGTPLGPRPLAVHLAGRHQERLLQQVRQEEE